MKQFKYHVEPRIINDDALNLLGQKGWELVIAQHGGVCIFKRELKTSQVNSKPQ